MGNVSNMCVVWIGVIPTSKKYEYKKLDCGWVLPWKASDKLKEYQDAGWKVMEERTKFRDLGNVYYLKREI